MVRLYESEQVSYRTSLMYECKIADLRFGGPLSCTRTARTSYSTAVRLEDRLMNTETRSQA